MGKKVIIIAEVGECWNGDKAQARKLIEIAADAGCDYVKFQTLDSDTVKDTDPEKDWFLKVALTDETIELFIRYSEDYGIRPLFTPANLRKAKLLKERFGFNEVKIASSVSFDKDTVCYIAENFKKVFLSTGMSSLDEVKEKVKSFEHLGDELYIMHCISEYPTGPLLSRNGLKPLAEEDVHLNMMLILKEMFGKHRVGYSDHTVGLLAPVCAAAAGADVIEKHITLDKQSPVKLFNDGKGYSGTDHALSLEPEELREVVFQIRQVEKIFGEKKWERTKGEKLLKDFLVGRF